MGNNKLRPFVIMDRTVTDTGAIEAGDPQVHGLLGIVLAILFGSIAYFGYNLTTAMFHVFSFLGQRVHDNWMLGQIGAVATVVVGTALYLVREMKRFWYALAELAFAALTGGFAVAKVGLQAASQGTQASSQVDLTTWVAWGASAYLIVRGLDNLKQTGVDVSAMFRLAIKKVFGRKRNCSELES